MLNFQGETSKLFDAIGTAMAAFKPLPRTATGSIAKGHTFQYAPLRKVVECIKTDLAKNSVSFMQALHTDGANCAVTLIVAGHGASVTSTFCFPASNDPKKFGADSTYYRRYQLTSFFGLEGDPDADDFEDPVSEVKEIPVEKTSSKEVVKEAQNEGVKASDKATHQDKPANSNKVPASVNDALIGAMKQLGWSMEDMNAFCREFPQHFPNFVKATALSEVGKATLLTLLGEHKGVANF
jgi:hypothetical protein